MAKNKKFETASYFHAKVHEVPVRIDKRLLTRAQRKYIRDGEVPPLFYLSVHLRGIIADKAMDTFRKAQLESLSSKSKSASKRRKRLLSLLRKGTISLKCRQDISPVNFYIPREILQAATNTATQKSGKKSPL